MAPKPLIIGEFIDHTPEGDVVYQMAMVLQRRETLDMHRNKVVHQIVGCPHCGEHHEHSDGPGFNGPNCGGSQGDYLVLPTPLRPVPRGTPYPKLNTRRWRVK